jgi:Fic family protein
MASQVRRRWQPTLASGLPRRDRLGCDFEAYLPDRLSGRKFVFRGDVAADIADAETAVQRLDLEATSLVDSEGLARLLLRAEAVASSRIEGLEVGGRRLLRAEAARAAGDPGHDITAEEILGNVNAMSWAIGTLGGGEPLRVEDLLEVHRRLVAGTRLEDQGGVIRDRQNWIGGSSYNPCQAAFVPPPPEEVPGLLEDLCAFCNQDHLPAIAQAAIAHAQFETIHPFSDGNGRTGRALIHVILRQRGLVARVLPPISLVLASYSENYVSGLTRTRYLGNPDQAQAREGLDDWISLFAIANLQAVDDAGLFADTVRELQVRWRARLGRVPGGSAVEPLLNVLPGTPVLTVRVAASMIGRTDQATSAAIGELSEAGILRQVHAGPGDRAFEAAELIDACSDLERRLAGGIETDTRATRPPRPVPHRRS